MATSREENNLIDMIDRWERTVREATERNYQIQKEMMQLASTAHGNSQLNYSELKARLDAIGALLSTEQGNMNNLFDEIDILKTGLRELDDCLFKDGLKQNIEEFIKSYNDGLITKMKDELEKNYFKKFGGIGTIIIVVCQVLMAILLFFVKMK